MEGRRDLDENTLLDLDIHGDICAIAVEHASERAGIPQFSYEQVTALTKDATAPVPSH